MRKDWLHCLMDNLELFYRFTLDYLSIIFFFLLLYFFIFLFCHIALLSYFFTDYCDANCFKFFLSCLNFLSIIELNYNIILVICIVLIIENQLKYCYFSYILLLFFSLLFSFLLFSSLLSSTPHPSPLLSSPLLSSLLSSPSHPSPLLTSPHLSSTISTITYSLHCTRTNRTGSWAPQPAL